MIIQKLIVWLTVKFASFFQIITLPLFAIGFVLRVPQNDTALVVVGSLFIGLFVLMGLNSIKEQVYYDLWPEKARDEDILRILIGKNVWAAAFIATCTFLFFATFTVNIMKSKEVWIDGKQVRDFRFINPFHDRVRDHGPKEKK